MVGASEVGVIFPHLSLAGCAVYRRMTYAYRKYGDADFSGGNQLVGTDGRVTIWVQAPATYYVTNWISVPHVHLRLCSSQTYAHATEDAFVFVYNGPELFSEVSFKNMSYAPTQAFFFLMFAAGRSLAPWSQLLPAHHDRNLSRARRCHR